MGKIAHATVGDELTKAEFEASSLHTINGTQDLEVVRSASYVLSSSDAPAHIKPQADTVCDGTGDNVDIQADIDLASAYTYDADVQLIGLRFSLSNTILITSNQGLYLHGMGKFTPRLVGDGTFDMLKIGDASHTCVGIMLKNLRFDFSVAQPPASTFSPLYLYQGTRLQFEHLHLNSGHPNCRIYNISITSFNDVEFIQGLGGVDVEDLEVANNVIEFKNCFVQQLVEHSGWQPGIRWGSGSSFKIKGGTFENNGEHILLVGRNELRNVEISASFDLGFSSSYGDIVHPSMVGAYKTAELRNFKIFGYHNGGGVPDRAVYLENARDGEVSVNARGYASTPVYVNPRNCYNIKISDESRKSQTVGNFGETETIAKTINYSDLKSLSSITVTAGGSGYTTPPTISFADGGGSGAVAWATIVGGAVTAVTLVEVGTGYTSAPTVSFSGGGGSGATATANVNSGALIIRLADVDDGFVVTDVYTKVVTTFNDSGPANIIIGDGSDTNGFLPSGTTNLAVAGYYGLEADELGDYLWDSVGLHQRHKIYTAYDTVDAIINGIADGTQGQVIVYVKIKKLT